MVDIHNYEQQYRTGEQHVLRSAMSQRNKDLILGYRDACLLHGVCGKVRLIRVFHVLLRTAALLQKDFDTLTRADVECVIARLLRNNNTPATIATHKAIIKRFLGWVFRPTEFPRLTAQPDVVAWMRVHVRKRDEPCLQRTELLTPHEIAALLQVCHNARDKALISMLWETGGRISELGNLQIKHVNAHEHGYVLDLTGKTGRRSPLIVSSAPHLATWLSHHPFKDNPDSPLWVHYQYRKRCSPIDYDTIRSMLRRHFQRAGITKAFHPHLFRHSRATYVLAHGIMTDAQARQYFGWTPQSNMIGRYAHLVDVDAHNAVLKENNLAPSAPATTSLTRQCPRCTTLNANTAPYCRTCTLPLDAKHASEHGGTDALVLSLARVLVEQGLLNQAVEQIHGANLGTVLRQLVTKDRLRVEVTAPHAAYRAAQDASIRGTV